MSDRNAYKRQHELINRELGAAAERDCTLCGKQAEQWAYDHTDPDEIASSNGPFSKDIEHYWPLCTSCHRLVDNAHLRRVRGLEPDMAPLHERIAAGAPSTDEWPPPVNAPRY